MADYNIKQAWPDWAKKPAVWHDASRDLWVKTPFVPNGETPTNRDLLMNGKTKAAKCDWNRAAKRWELARSRFNEIVLLLLDRWGECYLIQLRNVSEECAQACRSAKGPDCVCSCGGVNHGMDSDDRWFDISETYSVRHSHTELSIRLLTTNHRTPARIQQIKKAPFQYTPRTSDWY